MTPLERAARLPIWTGPVDPVPLTGGITNTNFVIDDRGRKVVVRIGDDIPVHHISRASEVLASRAAHAAGIAPAVIYAEPGVLALEFIEGRTLRPEDIRHPGNLPRIAEIVRRAHRDIPRFLRGQAPMFWVFHVVRDYAHGLREARSGYAATLPRLLDANRVLESAVGRIDVVFGHNDLLAANFLDDGERLWLVDWEYAGFNDPLFDLGGLASNNELDPPARDELLAMYHGAGPDAETRRRFAALTAASLLRETLWSMTSELHSRLDFDYRAYTEQNLARFDAAYADFHALGTS
jgi:thiamine kinase-like enzyme